MRKYSQGMYLTNDLDPIYIKDSHNTIIIRRQTTHKMNKRFEETFQRKTYMRP